MQTSPDLHRPVAVFDAGVGSYAAVQLIRETLPAQDVLYFADRASFPYGAKSRSELLAILRKTLAFLDGYAPCAILVASNAPSVTVLDDLIGETETPVFGVRPPIRQALDMPGIDLPGIDLPGIGDVAAPGVAVLGVTSLVQSPEMRAYANAQGGEAAGRVHLVDASALVELVETGDFLFRPDETRANVDAFVAELDKRLPGLGTFTLSSTHLPWLRSYLEAACGGRPLLDPLARAVAQVAPHAVAGQGRVLGLVTEDERYSVADFERMLERLGVSLTLRAVRP